MEFRPNWTKFEQKQMMYMTRKPKTGDPTGKFAALPLERAGRRMAALPRTRSNPIGPNRSKNMARIGKTTPLLAETREQPNGQQKALGLGLNNAVGSG